MRGVGILVDWIGNLGINGEWKGKNEIVERAVCLYTQKSLTHAVEPKIERASNISSPICYDCSYRASLSRPGPLSAPLFHTVLASCTHHPRNSKPLADTRFVVCLLKSTHEFWAFRPATTWRRGRAGSVRPDFLFGVLQGRWALGVFSATVAGGQRL